MARFCKYCGTQLEEDQVCSCPQAQFEAAQTQQQDSSVQQAAAPQPQAAPQQQAAPAAPSPIGIAFKNLIPFCKAYLRSPVEATRAAISQKDVILPIILLLIQAIAAGLVIFSLLNKVCRSIQSLIFAAMGLSSFSSLFGGGPTISASFIMCLIYGILASVIAAAIFVVVIFAAAKLMKSTCTIQDVLIACGANSLFVTVLLLLSFILFFLSIKIGIVLFVLAMLTWVIMGVLTTQAVAPGAEQGKFWILYIVAVLVALLVGGWISSKFFGLSINATKISYGGESITIGKALDDIGDLDFDEILEDMLYDVF